MTTPKSVTEDVQRIRSHPLVPKHIPIYGFIYDVKTGKLDEGRRGERGGQNSSLSAARWP